MKLVAITSCPTGIAQTFMAAESLENVAQEKGIEIKVETRSSDGVESKLTEQDIKEAAGVIIAAEIKIKTDRFVGKEILNVAVGEAIQDAERLIDKIIKKVDNFESDEQELVDEVKKSQRSGPDKYLLDLFLRIIPFVLLVGLVIVTAFFLLE